MTIGVNCGHTLKGAGNGAVGIFSESAHTRLVGYALMDKLRKATIKTVDCTIDQAASQQEYLAKVISMANQEELDWFISIHFNASISHNGQGTEVYTYKGQQYPEARAICSGMEKLGFINRGVKEGSGLYVIRKTKAKAMLVEVCFCDNQSDVELYYRAGTTGINVVNTDAEYANAVKVNKEDACTGDAVAQVIFDSICKQTGSHDATYIRSKEQEAFIEFVGKTARKDWKERRIMLPSVVIAQAVKESAWGTSELAREANALFGIKENGWKGHIYIKEAIEQKPDGSYDTIADTRWRAYDSWEQSILDHNSYIATRSTDGGKSLRYGPVIGCGDPELVCWYLQRCGYATSLTYAESLFSDFIVKYNLTVYDDK